jgi:hypothetical protein
MRAAGGDDLWHDDNRFSCSPFAGQGRRLEGPDLLKHLAPDAHRSPPPPNHPWIVPWGGWAEVVSGSRQAQNDLKSYAADPVCVFVTINHA